MTKATDVMIDLETYGTSNNAAIASIGGVKFNRDTGDIFDPFYVQIDPSSYTGNHGFDIEVSTFLWWLGQGEEARKALYKPHESRAPLHTALVQLGQWWPKGAKFWSHATFDAIVLQSAYRNVVFRPPWHYRDVRDLRTLCDLAPHGMVEAELSRDKKGLTHHNALDDAQFQAEYTIRMLKAIKGE
jgi:hypothetical protein